ncbi:MAG: hypothetical protein M5U34_27870 [Chloroflexi bacterium]|nr:hypothetical protein [Chloroflexota bacterium]
MHFSLVKKKPDGRIGLQDEVYDIFAQYMLRSEDIRQKEIKERQKVYSQLRDWAKYHHEKAQDRKPF